MAIKRDHSFFIYDRGRLQNQARLNDIGLEIYEYFRKLFNALNTDARTVEAWRNDIRVYITSQDYSYAGNRRTGRHGHGNAIDIQVLPIQWTPVIWIMLHRYFNFNVALALHNRHIHIDAAWRHNPTYSKNQKVFELRRSMEAYNSYDFVSCANNYLEDIPPHYYVVDRTKTQAAWNADPSGMLRRYNRTIRLNYPVFNRYDMETARYIPDISDITNARLWNYQGLCKTFTKNFYSERIAEADKSQLAESLIELVDNALPWWLVPGAVGLAGLLAFALLKSNSSEVKVYVQK